MEKFNAQKYVAGMAEDMMTLLAKAIDSGTMPDLPVVLVFDPHGNKEMRAALVRQYQLPDTASATMLLVTNDEALEETENLGAVNCATILRKQRSPWMIPVLVARENLLHVVFACVLPDAPGASQEIMALQQFVDGLSRSTFAN